MDLRTRRISTIPGSDGLFSPRWSPDGHYLAALNIENISKKLFIFDFQTGKWSDWVTDPESIEYPAWSSDSRYVEYQSIAGVDKVKRVKVGDTRPEVLFSTKGFQQYFTPEFGPWTDNGPGDSRIFLRDVSTQDIYALDVDFP